MTGWKDETGEVDEIPCDGCDSVCPTCLSSFDLFETLYSDAGKVLGAIMRFEPGGPLYANALVPVDKTHVNEKRLGPFTTPEAARRAVCAQLEGRAA